jgi:hypothetical protein
MFRKSLLPVLILGALLLAMLAMLASGGPQPGVPETSRTVAYTEFLAKAEDGLLERVTIRDGRLIGEGAAGARL